MKDTILICDLDGTLADCEHRRHCVEGDKKDWPSFFAGIPNDAVNMRVLWLLDKWQGPIWFVTGRAATHRLATIEWLYGVAAIQCHQWHIAMRADDDYRTDCIVKAEIYNEFIKPLSMPCLVIDDRSSVVAMWRGIGLECWQVAQGDF